MAHNDLFKILTGRYRHSINFAVNAELAGFWTRPNHLFDTMPYGRLIISIRVYVSTSNASKIIWIFARWRINSSNRSRRECLWQKLSKAEGAFLNWKCFTIFQNFDRYSYISSFQLENNNLRKLQTVLFEFNSYFGINFYYYEYLFHAKL